MIRHTLQIHSVKQLLQAVTLPALEGLTSVTGASWELKFDRQK
jgi:hypothetical protein